MSSCSQSKAKLFVYGGYKDPILNIPETITVHSEQPDYLLIYKMVDTFKQRWMHEDVLSMMRNFKKSSKQHEPLHITSTLSSRLIFKKRE